MLEVKIRVKHIEIKRNVRAWIEFSKTELCKSFPFLLVSIIFLTIMVSIFPDERKAARVKGLPRIIISVPSVFSRFIYVGYKLVNDNFIVI